MITMNLYRYDEDEKVIISPNKRKMSDVPYCYRLVADEGKMLTNGSEITYCIDTHVPDEWTEIDEVGEDADG